MPKRATITTSSCSSPNGLGTVDPFTERLDELGWVRRLYAVAVNSAAGKGIEMPEFDEFWERGYIRFPEQAAPFISFADFRRDPEQARLRIPSGRIELFSETVAGFGYEECPGHAVWREPVNGSAALWPDASRCT